MTAHNTKISDIVDALGVPDSTVRRYVKTFDEFFSSDKRGRTTYYSDDAILIAKHIYVLYEEGKTTAEIQEILMRQYPIQVDVNNTTLENIPALATVDDLMDIAAVQIQIKDALTTYCSAVQDLNDKYATLTGNVMGLLEDSKDVAVSLRTINDTLAICETTNTECIERVAALGAALAEQSKLLDEYRSENEMLRAQVSGSFWSRAKFAFSGLFSKKD